MLNWRTVLLGIFCVLFVASISLSQTELSDAEIIKEINASERRTRDHIDTKTESTNTKISEINTNVAVNTTNIGNMQADINELKGTVTWIWRGIIILIIGSVTIPIGLYFLRQWWENKGKGGESDATSTQVTQVNQNEETSEVSQSKQMPTNILHGRDFPHGTDLKDALKSNYHDKSRKV